jgi:hypothetical protein
MPGPALGIAMRLGGAERARGVEPRPVHRLERRLRLAQVERGRDERERDDHAGGREHELEPGVGDEAAKHALGPERRQQPDPRHRGRQHQRQLDQRDHRRAAAEAAGREQVGGRRAHDHDDRDRHAAAQQAQPQGLERAFLAEAAQEVERARVDEDRDDRHREERQRQAERHRQRDGEPARPAPAHRVGGGRKPAPSSACLPAPFSSPSMNALACFGCFAPFTTATP